MNNKLFRTQRGRKPSTGEQSELCRSVERPKAVKDRAWELREWTKIFEDNDGQTDHQKHDFFFESGPLSWGYWVGAILSWSKFESGPSS